MKKKLNVSNEIPPIFRLLKKKINALIKMEMDYWKELDKQIEKGEVIDKELTMALRNQFPENYNSLIHACPDGVVLVRHTQYDSEYGQVEVYYSEVRLNKFLLELPLPSKKGEWIRLGMILRLGRNGRINVTSSTFNNIEFKNLKVSVFGYDDPALKQWEDVNEDIKLALLSINSNAIENSSNKDLKAATIDRLIDLKKEFESKLESTQLEEEIQIFLKENPLLIQPHSNVYPKQKLGEDFITDFVLSNIIDQGISYYFVELERPNMPIFTKSGDFSSEFNHAAKQTLDWDVWLDKNKSYLETKLPKLEKPKYIIIAGRSKNLTEQNKSILRAWNRRQNDTEFYTYDDISDKLQILISNLQKE